MQATCALENLKQLRVVIQSVSQAVKDELCCFQKKISILVPWMPLNWRNLVALSGFCWAECESGGDGAAPAPGTEGRTRKFGCTRGIHQILAQQKRLAICPRNNIRQHRKEDLEFVQKCEKTWILLNILDQILRPQRIGGW